MYQHVFRRNVPVLTLVLVIVLAQASFARPAPDFDQTPQTPHASRPFPPTQYIPDHDFDTRHVALDLRFDWEREQLIGVETMVFKPLVADLRTIELDAANMTVASVKLAGNAALKYELDAA